MFKLMTHTGSRIYLVYEEYDGNNVRSAIVQRSQGDAHIFHPPCPVFVRWLYRNASCTVPQPYDTCTQPFLFMLKDLLH